MSLLWHNVVTKAVAFGFDLDIPSCCPCDFQRTSIYSIVVFYKLEVVTRVLVLPATK